jgi:enoyl-CoA hydratase
MAAGEVVIHRDGAVLAITLNRPTRLNSLTAEMLGDLADLIEEAGADASVRVVVLTGAGRAFSSGADLKGGSAEAAMAGERPSSATILAANRVTRALRAIPQPTIAAVNGPAVGVGCSIALACDLVVAAEDAYFLLSFTNIGLMPDGGATALVPASIGRARAMAMAIVPERVPAAEALAWGLIYKVVGSGELDATVKALTDRLATGAPLALAASKRAVNEVTLHAFEGALERELAGQSELLSTSDFVEAVVAFGEKRPPRFTGS